MRTQGSLDEVATAFVMGLDGYYKSKGGGFSWGNGESLGTKYRIARSWNNCAYAMDTWDGSRLLVIDTDDVWRQMSSHRRAIVHTADTTNTKTIDTSVRLLSLILSGKIATFPVEMLRNVINVTSGGGYWSFNLAGCNWVGGSYSEKRQTYYWASECPVPINHWSEGLISLIPQYCRMLYRDLSDNAKSDYADYLLDCMGMGQFKRGGVLPNAKYFVARRTLDRLWLMIKELPDVGKMKERLLSLLDMEGPYLPVCLTNNTHRQGDLFFKYIFTGTMPREEFPRDEKKVPEFLTRYSRYSALREYGNNFLATSYPDMFVNRHYATDVSYSHKTGEHVFSGIVRHPEHFSVKLDSATCPAEVNGKHWFTVCRNMALRSFSVPHGARGGGGFD